MWCVSFVDHGRSKTRVVPEPDRDAVQDLTQAYRCFREARREIQQLTQQFLESADALAEAQCQQGYRRYTRIAARAQASSRRSSKKGREAQ